MKYSTRIVLAALVVCVALISVSCSSDGSYSGGTVYVRHGYYGGYGPGWGYGWGGGYYAPPPIVIGPPDIPDIPVAEPF
jgi:hypothetical protein